LSVAWIYTFDIFSSYYIGTTTMRLLVVSIAIVIFSLAVYVESYQEDESNADEHMLYNKLRHVLKNQLRESMFMEKRKTAAGLANPDVLASCQSVCAVLRVDSYDEDKRKPYKDCRDKCVDEVLALLDKRNCPKQ
jgi:hypothetical protein